MTSFMLETAVSIAFFTDAAPENFTLTESQCVFIPWSVF